VEVTGRMKVKWDDMRTWIMEVEVTGRMKVKWDDMRTWIMEVEVTGRRGVIGVVAGMSRSSEVKFENLSKLSMVQIRD
jgi:hypothetical protein